MKKQMKRPQLESPCSDVYPKMEMLNQMRAWDRSPYLEFLQTLNMIPGVCDTSSPSLRA